MNPLSNDEQRELDQIERTLRDEDPEFAATIGFDHLRRHRRHQRIIARITFLLGISVMMISVVSHPPQPVNGVVSVAGYVMAAAAAGWLTFHQDHS